MCPRRTAPRGLASDKSNVLFVSLLARRRFKKMRIPIIDDMSPAGLSALIQRSGGVIVIGDGLSIRNLSLLRKNLIKAAQSSNPDTQREA